VQRLRVRKQPTRKRNGYGKSVVRNRSVTLLARSSYKRGRGRKRPPRKNLMMRMTNWKRTSERTMKRVGRTRRTMK
jgi:hypothetical protein